MQIIKTGLDFHIFKVFSRALRGKVFLTVYNCETKETSSHEVFEPYHFHGVSTVDLAYNFKEGSYYIIELKADVNGEPYEACKFTVFGSDSKDNPYINTSQNNNLITF